MGTRELVSEDAMTRVWRIIDDAGNAVGFDREHIRTPVEIDADTIRARAQAALATNNTYVAKPTTTNAEDKVQLKALTRECSALIRLLLQATDTTDGT